MPAQLDSSWLFDQDCHQFAAFGQRMDVAGLPRWSNPEHPTLRDGNHGACPPGAGLIPDQLVQLFDAQRSEGVGRRCIDVYGSEDERDALCLQMGLSLTTTAPLLVVRFVREQTPALTAESPDVDRTTPPVVELDRREWVDAVETVYHRSQSTWQQDIARVQATVDEARFFAIKIGETVVACVTRYDWPKASQLASLYTDPDFRRTGFAFSCASRALRLAPTRTLYAVVAGDNAATLAACRRAGGEVVLRDARRRYVGDWSET